MLPRNNRLSQRESFAPQWPDEPFGNSPDHWSGAELPDQWPTALVFGSRYLCRVKNSFSFQPRYFIFWLVFFAGCRGVFLAYHGAKTAALGWNQVLGTFGYGLRLDASMAAYLSALPFLLFIAGSLWGPRFPLGRLVGAYSAVLVAALATLTAADLELYKVWGFRVDDTLLQYLNSPAEMAASSGAAPLPLLFSLLGLVALMGWLLYRALLVPLATLPVWFGRGRAALAGLLYAALLVVPMRGGVQQIPVNQSDVYFSEAPFANHAALNVPWNLLDAALRRRNNRPLPPFMADSTARRLVAGLYPAAAAWRPGAPGPLGAPAKLPAVAASPTPSILSEPRPNVLFIILESFTAKLVSSVGGEAGVTPVLDSLARTGLLFNNIYAAGDRSQKGLVALLSGYPNHPTNSITHYPGKAQHLPHLARTLGRAGYSSHYYHGGELAFANIKSYLRTAGYEAFTERNDFPQRDQNSKWGAHDGALFARMLAELPTQKQPFFVTAFTLSSHEPFEVPMKPRFKGSDEAAKFRNSVAYTDYALGRFLAQARQQPWYAHTLVVLCADHGHLLPGPTAHDWPVTFHVPLVLAGGALRPEVRGRVVPVIGSQTDVAATVLAQLGLPAQDFVWSRNLLASNAPSFAFYTFTDGFGTVSPAGGLWFDNVGRRVAGQDAAVPGSQLRLGQALEQVSLEDFGRR